MEESEIAIHQITYLPNHLGHVEPSFRQYDNTNSSAPNEMEYRVFLDAYEARLPTKAKYTGFVSWKFRQKTKIQGHQFIEFIAANPGHDVYFINPFPSELVWKNVWLQGDSFHPGLLDFTQTLLDRLDYKIDLNSLENLSNTAAYCNYWVGTQEFWDRYMAFTQPLYRHIIDGLSASEREFFWKKADRKIEASYFPFLFERVFSTLLISDASIKSCEYTYSESEIRCRYKSNIAEIILTNYQLVRSDPGGEARRLALDLTEMRNTHLRNTKRKSMLNMLRTLRRG